MATDFNPNMDLSKFKTFDYMGGVEQHIRLPLNPDLLNNRIRRSVARELTAKGLREVKPEENPDLVVRYWIESDTDARTTGSVYWGTYGSYYTGHWTYAYSTVSAAAAHQGAIGIELIDANARDLAWRMACDYKRSW